MILWQHFYVLVTVIGMEMGWVGMGRVDPMSLPQRGFLGQWGWDTQRPRWWLKYFCRGWPFFSYRPAAHSATYWNVFIFVRMTIFLISTRYALCHLLEYVYFIFSSWHNSLSFGAKPPLDGSNFVEHNIFFAEYNVSSIFSIKLWNDEFVLLK